MRPENEIIKIWLDKIRMDTFHKIVGKITAVMMWVGAFFLLIIMVMTSSNIIYRLFWGKVILGSYELTEMMIVITAGFSMAYALITKTNVAVRVIISRLSGKPLETVNSFIAIFGVAIWGIIATSSVWVIWKKNFNEGQTELLDIPYLPLKWIWISALILIILIFVSDLLKSVIRFFKKWTPSS